MSSASAEHVDAVVVGSGPNGLSAAVTLARAGLSVRVYERNATVGGGLRTEELTLPGFRHDLCSAVHPLAFASGFFRRFGLAQRVPFVVPTASYGNPLPGGRVAMAYLDLERTVDALGVDGPAWRALLGPLVEHADAVAQFTGSQLLQVPRHPFVAARFGLTAIAQGGPWWDLPFRTEAPGALLSGVFAHTTVPLPSVAGAAAGMTLATYAHGFGAEIVEVPLKDGVTDPEAWAAAIDGETGAVFFQQPNFLGAVEDAEALAAAAKDSPAVVVGQYDPIPLGILKPPGECGVDVCVGEGQSLGNRLDFGGPSFGFFAATEAYLRRMPGRIAGETVDADGRRGFVLTLQTREQHIRREKATSNICTAQALNALAGVVYLSWLGRQGLVELGELLLQRTHYAREQLVALDGVVALHEQPVVREFAVSLPGVDVDAVIRRCQDAGVNPGYALGREYDEFPDGLLVALTEQRSKADIDRLVEVLGAAVAAERGATVGASA